MKNAQFLRKITVFLKKISKSCSFFLCHLSTNCAILLEWVSNWRYLLKKLVSEKFWVSHHISIKLIHFSHRFLKQKCCFWPLIGKFLIIPRFTAWSFCAFIIYFKISFIQAQPWSFCSMGWEILSKSVNPLQNPQKGKCVPRHFQNFFQCYSTDTVLKLWSFFLYLIKSV